MQSLTITSTQISSYQKSFKKPFTIAGQLVSERKGLILSLTAADWTGQGEIAPLEGVSSETLKKAQHDLAVIETQLTGCVIASEAKQSLKGSPRPFQGLAMTQDVLDFLRTFKPLLEVCPSVRFGVESAILDLVCKSQNISLVKFLRGKESQIPSAVLLQGSAAEILLEAKDFVASGHKVFKLKVGNRNIPLDVKKVADLRQVIPADARIRLDANKAWSLEEAALFAGLIGEDQIEFIEEPLADIAQLNQFYQKTNLPVALDETLSVMRCGLTAPGRCSPGLDRNEGVAAYILKPMVLGGITSSLDWIAQAKALGKKAIVSSSFESKIGLSILSELAQLTGEVSGLGTERWFS